MKKIVALVGMPGSGKTEAAKYLETEGFLYFRLGQVVLDEVRRRGEVSENSERAVRVEMRKEHGMGAMAELNLPKIDDLLKNGSVVIDDLYSWEEYKILKEKYGESNVTVVAICCSPATRYRRLSGRHFDPAKDARALYRSYGFDQAKARDYAQIEELHQGGPNLMADFYIINEGSRGEFLENVKKLPL